MLWKTAVNVTAGLRTSRRFSEIEELDRKVMIQLVHSIKVVGKNEFQIEFNYQNEYEKAISLIAPAQERMVV